MWKKYAKKYAAPISFSAILSGLLWLSHTYLIPREDMLRWVFSDISMEEKVRRALETPEEIASLQRDKEEWKGKAERLAKTLSLTEKENQRVRLELGGDNKGKAIQIERLEAERQNLLARVRNYENEKLSLAQRLIAKNKATIAACQDETRVYQSQLEQIKRDCVSPAQNIKAVLEDRTVYLVREGGEKEKVFGPISNSWEYTAIPLLNPSSTLLSFLATKTGYLSSMLLIKESLDSLSRTEMTMIEITGFSKVWNLKWVGERVMRVYLDPNGAGDINEHRIVNAGLYELELDEHASLKSVTRVTMR
uniref:Uncharacterized protein n=1 Tax=Candidatus Kentrum sp. TC TaxID=2126339 RepID=A0A450YQA6_9GAMM|nr:MAG: hypothetical protein BECKTC1821D_GA0114238_101814 [Candidatus Kentron sp. TC]